MDRTQQLSQDIVVYSRRCCRSSYGIVCRQLYDPKKHQGEDVKIDPRDKQKWAEGQIHWFIEQARNPSRMQEHCPLILEQGQVIHVAEGIKHRYRLKIDLGKEQLPWKTQIVMSTLPAGSLPRSMKHPGVKTLYAYPFSD